MSKWGKYLISRADSFEDIELVSLAESLEEVGISAIVPAIHLLGRQLADSEFCIRPEGTLFNALNIHAGTFRVGEYGRWDRDVARCIVLLPLRFAGSDYSVGSFQARHDIGYSAVCCKVFRVIEPENHHLEVVDPEDSQKPPSEHGWHDSCKCEISVAPSNEMTIAPDGLAMLAGSDLVTESLLLDFGRAIGEVALEEGISRVINSVELIDEALNELKFYYANLMLTFDL